MLQKCIEEWSDGERERQRERRGSRVHAAEAILNSQYQYQYGAD